MDSKIGFRNLITELNKPKELRKGFIRKRKNTFIISDDRINKLYDKYFSSLSGDEPTFHFQVDLEDIEEIIYLLRVHFQLWMEIDGFHITIYQNLPKWFRITEDVHTENHPHTPVLIPKGTIMELAEDHFGVVNFSKGIPLSGKILIEDDNASNNFKPFLQINYPFIEAIH